MTKPIQIEMFIEETIKTSLVEIHGGHIHWKFPIYPITCPIVPRMVKGNENTENGRKISKKSYIYTLSSRIWLGKKTFEGRYMCLENHDCQPDAKKSLSKQEKDVVVHITCS